MIQDYIYKLRTGNVSFLPVSLWSDFSSNIPVLSSYTGEPDFIEAETKKESNVHKNYSFDVEVLRCLVLDNRRLLIRMNKHQNVILYHRGRFGALSNSDSILYLVVLFLYILYYIYNVVV